MASFSLSTEIRPNSRAKCQACSKGIEKGSPVIIITEMWYFTRGYIHSECIAGLLDQLLQEGEKHEKNQHEGIHPGEPGRD